MSFIAHTSAYPATEQPSSSRFKEALADLKNGIESYQMWGILAWYDILQRYRRSILGPFWITLSMGIMIFALGFLYSRLFHQTLASYFPYISSGMIVWNLISTSLNESCMVFISAESIIKQIKLPLTFHICRLVWRNLIIFAHNFVIFVIVYAIWGNGIGWNTLLFPVGLLLLAYNMLWVGLLLGVFCTRFRDVPQIVGSLLQVLFFVTPVMWNPNVLSNKMWIIQLNPVYHFLMLLRDPLLNQPVPLLTWGVVLGVSVIGSVLTLMTLSKFRHRLSYWV
jgi:ABC-type polysaccharide/polyol phosphate export permease